MSSGMNLQLIDNLAFKILVEKPEYIGKFKPEFFDDELKQNLFKLVKKHNETFNEAPTKEQLKELYSLSYPNADLEQVSNYINILYSINTNEYTAAWLEDAIKSYISIKSLDISVKNLITYLKTTKISMDNVSKVLDDANKIIAEGTTISFDDDIGKSIYDPESYIQKESFKISSGYSFIDVVTNGGFSRPGLHVFVGPPKVGKTIWLQNVGLEMVKQGMNGAFISLEMPEYAMLQRFGPKLYGIKLKEFSAISQNPYEIGKVISSFRKSTNGYSFDSLDGLFNETKPGELFLKEFPTSTATTNDLRAYLKKLMDRTGVKLDFVVVDYINIMANWRLPNTESTYLKIKHIAEDLRALSQEFKVSVITATQTKAGVEENSDFNSGAVAESSGLNHTVDSEWGIIMTPEMYARREYVLKCLLNRHGGMKYAKKKFYVDFDYMSIIESNEPIEEEQSYL